MPPAGRAVLILLLPLLSACADGSHAVPSDQSEPGEGSSSLAAAGVLPGENPPSGRAIPVSVDPAVELISTIYRLAGLSQYMVNHLPPYIDDVEERFNPWRAHRAVSLAQELWENHRITGSAPVARAIFLTPPPELNGRVPLSPLPQDLDPRWTPETVSAFLEMEE